MLLFLNIKIYFEGQKGIFQKFAYSFLTCVKDLILIVLKVAMGFQGLGLLSKLLSFWAILRAERVAKNSVAYKKCVF